MKIEIRETKKKLDRPSVIAAVFQEILRSEDEVDRDKEHFWVLAITRAMTVKYAELVSLGTLDSSVANPREVFRRAVLNAAHSIILIHNHPSGNIEPSIDDARLTSRLKEAGNILGIKVLEHLIISDAGFFSFQEHGMFS